MATGLELLGLEPERQTGLDVLEELSALPRSSSPLVAPEPSELLDMPLQEAPASAAPEGKFSRAFLRGTSRSAVGILTGQPESETPAERDFLERAVENLGSFFPDLPLYVAGGGVGGTVARTALKGVLRHYLTRGFTPQAALNALKRSALARFGPPAGQAVGALTLPETVKEVAGAAIKGEEFKPSQIGKAAALGAAVGVTGAAVPGPVLKFLAETGVFAGGGALLQEGRLPTIQELLDTGVALGLIKAAFLAARIPWPARAIEPAEILPPRRTIAAPRSAQEPDVIDLPPPEPPRGRPMPPSSAPMAPEPAVPETPATLVQQFEALARGDKPAVLLPPGVTPAIPERFGQVETSKGVVVFNPAAAGPFAEGFPGETLEARIRAAVETDREGKILGYGVETKPAPGEPATLMETRGPKGKEVQTVLTPAPPPQETIESAKRMIPLEGGEVRVTGPERAGARTENIIGERLYQGRGAPPEVIYSPHLIEAGVAGPILGPAKYYAFKREDAERYGQVTEHEVELRRPFLLDSDKSWFDLLGAADAEVLSSITREYYTQPEKIPAAARRVQDYLRSRGYDGVIVRLGKGDTNLAGQSNKRLRESFGHDQVIMFVETAARPSAKEKILTTIPPPPESEMIPSEGGPVPPAPLPPEGGEVRIAPPEDVPARTGDLLSERLQAFPLPPAPQAPSGASVPRTRAIRGREHPAEPEFFNPRDPDQLTRFILAQGGLAPSPSGHLAGEYAQVPLRLKRRTGLPPDRMSMAINEALGETGEPMTPTELVDLLANLRSLREQKGALEAARVRSQRIEEEFGALSNLTDMEKIPRVAALLGISEDEAHQVLRERGRPPEAPVTFAPEEFVQPRPSGEIARIIDQGLQAPEGAPERQRADDLLSFARDIVASEGSLEEARRNILPHEVRYTARGEELGSTDLLTLLDSLERSVPPDIQAARERIRARMGVFEPSRPEGAPLPPVTPPRGPDREEPTPLKPPEPKGGKPEIIYDKTLPTDVGGFYDATTHSIRVSANLSPERTAEIIKHELEHAQQASQGILPESRYMPPETSIRAFMEYFVDPSEVKARAAEKGEPITDIWDTVFRLREQSMKGQLGEITPLTVQKVIPKKDTAIVPERPLAPGEKLLDWHTRRLTNRMRQSDPKPRKVERNVLRVVFSNDGNGIIAESMLKDAGIEAFSNAPFSVDVYITNANLKRLRTVLGVDIRETRTISLSPAPSRALRGRRPQRSVEETPLLEQEQLPGIRENEALDLTPEMRQHVLYDTRPEIDPVEAQRLASRALGDIERAADAVRVSSGRLPIGGGLSEGAGVRLFALSVPRQLAERGFVDLRGLPAETARDLALAAEVSRSPYIETLSYYAIKDGKIVAVRRVSSRLPGSAALFVQRKVDPTGRLKPLDTEEAADDLRGWLERSGADAFAFSHNHPSGDSRPSLLDIETTQAIVEDLNAAYQRTRKPAPAFKGHIVRDGKEFHVIGQSDQAVGERHELPEGREFFAESALPSPFLGHPIRSATDIAEVAGALKIPENYVTILAASGGRAPKLRAVLAMPVNLFRNVQEATNYLRGAGPRTGGQRFFAYYTGRHQATVIKAGRALIKNGSLADHLSGPPETSLLGVDVTPPEGIKFGKPEQMKGFRVAEPGDELTEDLMTYGRHLLGMKRIPFHAWADQMAADLGEGVRPFLPEIYDRLAPAREQPFTLTKTAVPTTATPTTTGTRVSTGEVVQHFSSVFKIPIRIGHFRRPGATGIYKQLEQVARLKGYGDLATAAHEVAHHVEATTNVLHRRLTPAERKELKALDYKPKRGSVDEGFAEFIRHYLTTDEAARLAPNFSQRFTAWLPSSGLADAFSSSRAIVDQWRGQGSLERVKAQIAGTEKRFAQTRRLFSRPRTLWHWFVDNFYNRLSPLKRTAEEMAGTKQVLDAMPIEAAFWPFAKVATMTASAKARNMALYGMADKAGNKAGSGLVEILSPIARELQDPETLHDWYAYTYARHALDVIARGKEPGIKEEDARAVVDLFAARPGWEKAADGLTQWHRQLIDYLVDAGGLSPEVAELFQRLYPNYISLARHIEDIQTGGPGGRYANLPAAVRRLKGSGRPILPPLETALIYAERIIGLADKYRVGNMLVTAAEQYGKLGEIAERVSPDLVPHTFSLERIKDQLKKLGADLSSADLDGMLTLFENNIRPDPLDNILVLWRHGERQAWRLREDLYRALLALDKPFRLPKVLHVTLGAVARAIRLGATGLRAGFSLITNPLRDVQTAIMQTEAQRADPASVALGSVRGMLRDLTNDELARIFKRGGGQMAQPLGIDRRFLQEAIQEILAQDPKSRVLNWMRHPVDSLREVFSIPELGPRLAEFEAELKRLGWTPGQPVTFEQYVKAQFKAQNVTVDFREGGSLSMWLNQIVPFFNANVQGPARMADMIRRHPWDVLRRGLLWLTLPTLALWWAYKDEEWYVNLPPMERYRYWHIKLPNGAVLRPPKPFEWGHLFSSIPEAAMDWAYRQEPTAMKEALGRTLQDVVPPFIPGAFQPAIEVLANRDLYFDRPLVGERLKRLPPAQQVQPWTTETARAIGKLFGVAPIYVEHLTKKYTGGLAPDLLAAGEYIAHQTGVSSARGTRPPQLADVPVAGRLFLRPEVTRVFDDFYTHLESLEQAQAGRRELLGIQRGRRMPAPGDLARMRSAARRLSDASDRARRIVESDQSDDEKQRALTEIHEGKLAIAKHAMGEQTYSGRTLRGRVTP